MKIYYLDRPVSRRFADALPVGTFSGSGLCPECGASRREVVPPLIIEWIPGSEDVGDFTPVGLMDHLVVTERVRAALQEESCGFEFGLVKMHQDPKLRQPASPSGRTKPRVWLPYAGPPLWHLIPNSWCEADIDRSGIVLSKICTTCGRRTLDDALSRRRSLVINPATWRGEGIFRVREYPGSVYCTEDVKDFIESNGFTNVAFQFDGEIPEAAGHGPGVPKQELRSSEQSHESRLSAPVTLEASRPLDEDSSGLRGNGHEPPDVTSRIVPEGALPSYDEMPENNEDLARIQVLFPYLQDNSAESCPVTMEEILEYLSVEVPGGEDLELDDLEFLRTAQVGEQKFWIWRFTDPAGAKCYVTVSVDQAGNSTVGYDENYYGLSPEQFALGVYHQVF